MAAPGGVPVRSCARVVGSADSQKLDNGSIFIAGNAMELVPSGKSDGEKHTFSRIFDVHASDKDVYESEVLPLIGGMVAGENVSVITMGHHRGGHGHLLGVIAPLCAPPQRSNQPLTDRPLGRAVETSRAQDDPLLRPRLRLSLGRRRRHLRPDAAAPGVHRRRRHEPGVRGERALRERDPGLGPHGRPARLGLGRAAHRARRRGGGRRAAARPHLAGARDALGIPRAAAQG